ncbi:MAG: Z1 domain-containing protein [Acidipila sp.]|nr:Z1 domain-containing protein [Acidipila sp.]
MNSGSEAIENYLRVLRVHIDALGQTLDEALSAVPAEHRDAVRARFEEEFAQPIRRANILSGAGGPKEWFQRWDPSAGYYWRRLRAYLLDRIGRSSNEVESLDDSTDTILSHLEDPRVSGPAEFQTRGLVLGYVQSGKTANFSALTAKAADLGYKLVVVLSGIDNGLRQQTQRRLDKELGLSGSQGVGEPEAGKRWISLTSSVLDGDFRPGTVGHNVLQGNEHVLAVVKKNATVLRRLVQWMDQGVPPGLPVLVIDDEADQASINTGGNRPPRDEGEPPEEEIDPSVINGLIRSLLRSFRRVAYVSYTATPFANILINHEAIDREVWEDLYPKDFIVNLPRLPGYVGAERLFGRVGLPGDEGGDIGGVDVVRLVSELDMASVVPAAGQVDVFQPQLCDSLRDAFLDFVLAIAARAHRTGADHPASMLIHTHHRTLIQNRMGDLAREHVSVLRQQWRYDRETIQPILRNRWESQFRPVIASTDVTRDVPFEAIEPQIDHLFRDPIRVIVLNSASPDVLDYEAEPNLKAVLIGGNRLSRGLTIEGLLVSYYVRKVGAFDTLLQMGRWFGYRENYVDLTRLWTTSELAELFSDVALAEEELRREAERYERERITPTDFGLKIRAHPVMLVTAENKMGAARQISQNYSGRLLQTTTFRLEDLPWLRRNLTVTSAFLHGLGAPASLEKGRFIWSGVDWQAVDEFLSQYSVDPRSSFMDMASIRQYIAEQVRQDELVNWTVAVVGQEARTLDTENLGIVQYGSVNTISRTRLRDRPHSVGVLTNPATINNSPRSGDEEIGLTDEQLLRARANATNGRFGDLGSALRSERDRREGLLLVYPVSKQSRPRQKSTQRLPLFENPERDGCTVIGVALVFPQSDSAATIEYIVGSVGDRGVPEQ